MVARRSHANCIRPDVEQFSELLRAAVWDTTVAIHWDYEREVLRKADGVIATVGLEANVPQASSREAGTARTRAAAP